MYMNFRDERKFSLQAIKSYTNYCIHVLIIYVSAYINSICEKGKPASDQFLTSN